MNESKNILKKQKNIFFAILTIGLVLACGVFYAFVEDQKPIAATKKIDLPGDKVDPQDLWMTRFESESKIFDQRVKYLEEIVLENKRAQEAKNIENNDLRREVSKLKSELQLVAESERNKETLTIPERPTFSSSNDPLFANVKIEPIVIRAPLAEIVAERPKSKVLHVDSVIPAGTTVKAVLVSSIDAPCGVLAHSDPQPVKLRILDDGHLPKGVDVDMKGGIIIASVHGDLSSERVYMRIERLTQVKENGDFIETEVAGFVTGEDGKYGVRGSVVDKSLSMVGNAAMSGFISGINDYLQAKASHGWVTSNANANETVDATNGDIFLQGGVRGGGSAFDKLTDYYIQRAEQIRPIIQVTAGRIVDITFTHGTEVGDLHVKNKIREIRKKSRGKACLEP